MGVSKRTFSISNMGSVAPFLLRYQHNRQRQSYDSPGRGKGNVNRPFLFDGIILEWSTIALLYALTRVTDGM